MRMHRSALENGRMGDEDTISRVLAHNEGLPERVKERLAGQN